eukprot:GSMAST32.ASY1.ANO1.972.1 assembled CDS
MNYCNAEAQNFTVIQKEILSKIEKVLYDGTHIKGLLVNLFHHFWPGCLTHPNSSFLKQFITPLVKIRRGKGGNKTEKSFYSQIEFDTWKNSIEKDELSKYFVKYYKGLGTSTAAEGKEYFAALTENRIDFVWGGDEDDDAIDMAFKKSRIVDRKKWLEDETEKTEKSIGREITYSDFVNKELIQFSHADILRSIPSVIDGFKPSQRKVLYSSQLAGYISEHSGYHVCFIFFFNKKIDFFFVRNFVPN